MQTIFASFRPSAWMLALGFLLFSTTTTLQSCAPVYDALGVQNLTDLSKILPDLMGKAVKPFSENKDAVTQVMTKLNDTYTHAAAIKGNKEIAQSWKILKDEIATPFFDRWKEKGKLDKDFVAEATKQVTKSLEAIKKAEMSKKK